MTSDRVSKASRLFQFLADVRYLKEKHVTKTEQFRDGGGTVLTFDALTKDVNACGLEVGLNKILLDSLEPGHPFQELDDEYALLRIERPASHPLPEIPSDLTENIDDAIDNPQRKPSLSLSSSLDPIQRAKLQDSFNQWLNDWEKWADSARALAMYSSFFEMQTHANQQADEYELVLALGNLSWETGNDDSVDRHLFVVNLEPKMDKQDGHISFSLADGNALIPELESIPTAQVADGRFIEELKQYVSEFEGNPLNLMDFSKLGIFLANGLTTSAEFVPQLKRVPSQGDPIITWAPAVILRPRQRIGLATAFQEIARLIEEEDKIPPGLIPLVDPNFESKLTSDPSPGAVLNLDGEIYSPLPLNEKQKQVLNRVDSVAQTIVQGPPGTGKTHMAAALLSHLSAQGKRVLVTAEKERALYELRDKLPLEIRELAVSVVSSSKDDHTELRNAIETIQRRSSNYDLEAQKEEIERLESKLRKLKEQRTDKRRAWASLLENQQIPLDLEGYQLPLPKAIQKINSGKEQHEWISECQINDYREPFPLTRDQLQKVLQDVDAGKLLSLPDYERTSAIDPQRFPSVSEFENLVSTLNEYENTVQRIQAQLPSEIYSQWSTLSPEQRREMNQASFDASQAIKESTTQIGNWANLLKLNATREEIYQAKLRVKAVEETIQEINSSLQVLDGVRRIAVNGRVDSFVPIATNLERYLASGKIIKTRPDGTVKIPKFGGDIVKHSLGFFQNVQINSLPATTHEEVLQYLAFVEVSYGIHNIQKNWPYNAGGASSPAHQVQIVRDQLQDFKSYIASVEKSYAPRQRLTELGFSTDPGKILALQSAQSTLDTLAKGLHDLHNATERFRELAAAVNITESSASRSPWMEAYSQAVESRDPQRYREVINEGQKFYENHRQALELAATLESIALWSPTIHIWLLDPNRDSEWNRRLLSVEDARQWFVAKNFIDDLGSSTEDDVLNAISLIDENIHITLSTLAAARAWTEAVGPDRIDGEMRAILQRYAQAVKRLGKGTGKHAELHRRSVRKHLQDARSAVPIWIMPIYKVVEQFTLEQDMFDVVLIDEASQAGIEAVFLQYLAPRIIVIGDEHQVSPEAVGQDLDRLKSIGRQYLYDFKDEDLWTDPKTSLFDDANGRYGGRISLEEHRRCVPEIIEFSNELTYRPNNIELKPVRTLITDRLAPFRITHTPNANSSSTNGVNRDEADLLVLRVCESIEDPRYAGKTFGIISLLSNSKQADYIQARLLRKLPPHVWEERDLKVGNPADFQGAERDVIFLSMVTAANSGKRISALTRDLYVKRYNVAVSRAKDQVWLFHSVDIAELTNPDDVRRKLLEYSYRVANSRPEKKESSLVSYDQHEKPFDSLFEQRVYNDLVQLGFHVIPQFDVFGRKIDLVVQGENNRLAVECDGDYWHSNEHALHDLNRQRELERLGWKFVRIFESDYYLSKGEQIQRIVSRLEELGIERWATDTNLQTAESNVEVIHSAIEELGQLDNQAIEMNLGEVHGEDTGGYLRNSADPLVTQGSSLSTSDMSNKSAQAAEPKAQVTQIETAEPYEAFLGATDSVYDSQKSQIDQGILEIISVEGPIMESALFRRYVTQSGFKRVAENSRQELRAGLARLKRRGEIELVREQGKSYKLPSQPEARPRTLGPREIAEVPSAEWRAHMETVIAEIGPSDEEAVFREVMAQVGIKRLTDNVRTTLLPHYQLLIAD